jgi:hypothetical protein
MTLSPYLLYLPDLAVCDLFLFQKLMMSLKGRRFNDVTDFKKLWGYLPRSKNAIHKMLQMVVRSLALPYKV